MPIEVNWFNEQKTAVLMNFEGQWTWEPFYAAIDEAFALLDTISHKAALIIDLGNSEGLPKNSIANIRNAQGMHHPQRACVIFVGMNTFMRMIGNLALRLSRGSKGNVYIVATLDDALQYIPQTMNIPNNQI
jgi:hypothetical protein